MSENLVFTAGRKILPLIREEGLRPDMVKVMVGAAGGPRWLVLAHLDRMLFSGWLKDRKEPLFLLGSSIGSWRFAAAAQEDPGSAIERLLRAYIHLRFTSKPTPVEITRESKAILESVLNGAGTRYILEHPYLRLSVMAARCRWPVSVENRVLLSIGLFDAALYNAVHRNGLRFFFERSLFYDSRESPPFFAMNGFPTCRIPLSRHNVKEALLASASIPMAMSGVRNIPGAPKGIYRDGGVIEYHFNIPFIGRGDGVVLFPHFMDRIIPGWFDKKLPWRKPLTSNLDNVLMVSPSREFIEGLPHGRIPDRRDFVLFRGRDDDRIAVWKTISEASRRLGDEFMDAVESGSIRRMVKPMP